MSRTPEPGTCAVASRASQTSLAAVAAVLDEYRYPVAAVTVMAPSFRLKRDQFEKLGHLCIQAAETITRRLLA